MHLGVHAETRLARRGSAARIRLSVHICAIAGHSLSVERAGGVVGPLTRQHDRLVRRQWPTEPGAHVVVSAPENLAALGDHRTVAEPHGTAERLLSRGVTHPVCTLAARHLATLC